MRQAKVTRQLAKDLANDTNFKRGTTWDDVRDYVDLYTASDLDNFQLNLLTDWVWDILSKKSVFSVKVFRV